MWYFPSADLDAEPFTEPCVWRTKADDVNVLVFLSKVNLESADFLSDSIFILVLLRTMKLDFFLSFYLQ